MLPFRYASVAVFLILLISGCIGATDGCMDELSAMDKVDCFIYGLETTTTVISSTTSVSTTSTTILDNSLKARCDRTSDPFSCVENEAYVSGDEKICNTFNETTEVRYKTQCMIGVAMNKRDPDICNKMPSDYVIFHGMCIGAVADKLDNPLLCKTFELSNKDETQFEKESRQENCYMELAARRSDVDFCEQVTRQDLKGKCYGILALQLDDPDLCESPLGLNIKDICYREFACKKEVIGYCHKVKSDLQKGKCIRTIAREKKDPELCKFITHDIEREKCILDTAE